VIDGGAAATALARASRRLEAAGIEDPRLEARILMERCLGLSRVELYREPDRPLSPAELAAYESLVARRAGREPLAYVVGHREFFGLDFLVDRRVLVPRPETELLVEEALRVLGELPLQRDRPPLPPRAGGAEQGLRGERGARSLPSPAPVLADVGTGSGAIAVSLAVHRPDALVYAADVSAEALEVAAENARRHGVAGRVVPLLGDLLAPLPERVDLIAANLPYVSAADLARAQPEVAREPRLALDGGADGLAVYRRLLAQAPGCLRPGGALLFEIGAGQGSAAVEMAAQAFPGAAVRLLRDHAGLDRVVVVEVPATGPGGPMGVQL